MCFSRRFTFCDAGSGVFCGVFCSFGTYRRTFQNNTCFGNGGFYNANSRLCDSVHFFLSFLVKHDCRRTKQKKMSVLDIVEYGVLDTETSGLSRNDVVVSGAQKTHQGHLQHQF